MTVIELITVLYKMPKDAEVLVDDEKYGLASIVEVEEFPREKMVSQVIIHSEAS